jgi:two-component system LytT family response regulator
MTIHCIIIEDEPLAMERARGYVQKIPFLSLQATFDNGVAALVYLQEHKTDLIFLDINMGELSGIRLLEAANIKCEVIITTAYDEYALKGFELNVTDYLLKPYTFERFLQAVGRAKENIGRQPVRTARPFIFVKTEYRLEKLLLGDLLYIEGMRDYRRLHTSTKKIMTLQTFQDFEQEIPEQQVCRVHKSFMVALDKIDSIERDRIRIQDAIIPVSETYKKRFFELIGNGPGR